MARHRRTPANPAAPLRHAGLVALFIAFGAGPGAAQPPPAGRGDGPDAWQRQQPTRERVQDLLQQDGIQPSPAERPEELRSLNEIHRQLMPPGTTVPAPGLAPPASGASRS
jgi:hypothetical protein